MYKECSLEMPILIVVSFYWGPDVFQALGQQPLEDKNYCSH